MGVRRKRALLWSAGVLVVCSIPVWGRIWLEQNGALERPDLGVVGEFVVRDQFDVPLTRDQMRRSISIIVYWPESCAPMSQCESARKSVGFVRKWVDDSLKPKWTEERNPLILGAVGEAAAALPELADWRRFRIKPDAGTLLPHGADLNKPWLVVIDHALQFAALEELERPVSFSHLERVLSKTAFDQYLGNYLSSRTFMGPKRRQN